jgi:quinol monooxygenase YgiN
MTFSTRLSRFWHDEFQGEIDAVATIRNHATGGVNMSDVIVEFTHESGCDERFRERVRRQAEDSLQLDTGCHVFDVCIDPMRDDFVMLCEVYSDRDAFDDHLASAHFKDFDDTVRDWIVDQAIATLHRI